MIRMLRLTITVATLALAGAAVGSAQTTQPQTNACSVPAVNGFTVTALSEKGIGCAAAKDLVLEFIKKGKVAGYDCSQRVSGRTVNATCQSPDKTKMFATTYSVK
jgi:hypothetical protein